MKALIQTEYGDPAKVLELRDVPPLYPSDGQAIVAIEAAVVHVADARTVLGMDGFRKKLPRTPGYEGVGRVSAVARDVTGVTVGQRVFRTDRFRHVSRTGCRDCERVDPGP